MKGYTLVETIIAIALFAVLGIAIASFIYIYVEYNDFLLRQSIETEVQNSHWQALGDLELSFHQARQVTSSLIIDGQSYETSSATLVLELYSIDAEQNILENYFDYFVYYPDAASTSILMKRVVASAFSSRYSVWQPLNKNVENLRFFYNDSNPASSTKITIAIRTKKEYQGIIKTASTTMEAALR